MGRRVKTSKTLMTKTLTILAMILDLYAIPAVLGAPRIPTLKPHPAFATAVPTDVPRLQTQTLAVPPLKFFSGGQTTSAMNIPDKRTTPFPRPDRTGALPSRFTDRPKILALPTGALDDLDSSSFVGHTSSDIQISGIMCYSEHMVIIQRNSACPMLSARKAELTHQHLEMLLKEQGGGIMHGVMSVYPPQQAKTSRPDNPEHNAPSSSELFDLLIRTRQHGQEALEQLITYFLKSTCVNSLLDAVRLLQKAVILTGDNTTCSLREPLARGKNFSFCCAHLQRELRLTMSLHQELEESSVLWSELLAKNTTHTNYSVPNDAITIQEELNQLIFYKEKLTNLTGIMKNRIESFVKTISEVNANLTATLQDMKRAVTEQDLNVDILATTSLPNTTLISPKTKCLLCKLWMGTRSTLNERNNSSSSSVWRMLKTVLGLFKKGDPFLGNITIEDIHPGSHGLQNISNNTDTKDVYVSKRAKLASAQGTSAVLRDADLPTKTSSTESININSTYTSRRRTLLGANSLLKHQYNASDSLTTESFSNKGASEQKSRKITKHITSTLEPLDPKSRLTASAPSLTNSGIFADKGFHNSQQKYTSNTVLEGIQSSTKHENLFHSRVSSSSVQPSLSIQAPIPQSADIFPSIEEKEHKTAFRRPHGSIPESTSNTTAADAKSFRPNLVLLQGDRVSKLLSSINSSLFELSDMLIKFTESLNSSWDEDLENSTFKENDRMRRSVKETAPSQNVECVDQGGPVPGSDYIRLCAVCVRNTDLGPDVFPRYLTERVCHNTSAYQGCLWEGLRSNSPPGGLCQQQQFHITVLRRIPNECMRVALQGKVLTIDRWELSIQPIRVGCECVVNKISQYAPYVKMP